MPSQLVSAAQAEAFLGIAAASGGATLQQIIDGLDELLASLTNQRFSAIGLTLSEWYNGTGRGSLWLRSPAATLSSVKIGTLAASSPSEELDVARADVIGIDPALPRRIFRQDGGIFPKGIRNVLIGYTTVAHSPAAAQTAVLEAAAFLWRRRGSEDALQESEGSFSHALANDLREHVPAWAAYVDHRHRPAVL